MGEELVGFEAVEEPIMAEKPSKENGSSVLHHDHNKENNNVVVVEVEEETIKFGSHGDENNHAKVEAASSKTKTASQAPSPMDVVDDWPSSKQVHLIKYRSLDDPTLKAKLDQGDKEFQKVTQARYRIIDQQRAIKSERIKVFEELKILNEQHRKKQSELDQKRREIAPLQVVFSQLSSGGAKGDTPLCSSEEELDDLIYSLNYRIQHESIPLTDEKKILREVKQLEQTREKVIANAEMRAKIQNDIGEDKSIDSHYKAMGGDLTGARREHQRVRDRIEQLEKKKKIFETELKSLQEEFEAISEVKDKGYKNLQQLRLLRDERNAVFYQNRSLLNRARHIADVQRDVKAVEEFARVETEKFMSQWNSNKAFRDDYEKRILLSLDNRQLSRDGRIRNPDEKPLVAVEVTIPPSKPEPLVKVSEKQAKKEKKKPTKIDSQPIKKAKEEKKKPSADNVPSMEEEEILYRPPKKEKEVDVEKLKETRRQEEIAKAKQAMERKKKRAEKAAAIAAIIAQREAEKKLKEREKKGKKKAAISTTNSKPEEQAEGTPEVVEAENAEMPVEALVSEKNMEKRKNPSRQRIKLKTPDPLPRAILKRKKATNYWLWAAPAAVTLILSLALSYLYLQ